MLGGKELTVPDEIGNSASGGGFSIDNEGEYQDDHNDCG
jgi:hypothetical protein